MDNAHVVYMLECRDGSIYTGYTNDFERRLKQHEAGKGAKYTRGRGPFKVIHKKTFETKVEAMREEYRIKRLSRHDKLTLINAEQEGFHHECPK
ncbi:GIY-YIG nuclease family protein [Lentibacillus saliphilus]|uniref:GIY-YIG nuclease family protein n=1 Tax=Lentibacillus saliphilus TaxID=2737028 RepID=UPI001C2F550A|nr:GIY-YIG nuclease family protein [Lentibacillus saliphilus]